MPASMGRDFGGCRCGSRFDDREVEVRFPLEEPVELDSVPQGLCPNCGSRVYKAEMLERLEAIFTAAPIDPLLARPRR
jgi:hypothetical protein